MTPESVIHAALRTIFAPWLRLWRGIGRIGRRVFLTLVGTAVLVVVTANVAYAGEEGVTGPAALQWITFTDSHDLHIWQYEMSLDRGGASNPGKLIWSFFVDNLWEGYRAWVAVACWLVNWTLSFSWLTWISQPVADIGDGVQGIVDHFGFGMTAMLITVIAAALLVARGKWTTGIYELAMSSLIAALAIGALANPVALIAGDNGMLRSARDGGLEVAATLNEGSQSPETEKKEEKRNNHAPPTPGATIPTGPSTTDMRNDLTGMISDTFLRRPQQMVNFGEVLDGGKCEDTYQKTVKKGPYGTGDELRNAIKDCDETAGKVAENPNAGMLWSMMTLYPTAFIVLLFAMVLCCVVIVAGMYAAWQSIKMIIALPIAIAPGAARGMLWMTFAETLMSMVTVVFSVVFLAAYLVLVQSVFDTSAKASNMSTFFVVDVMLMVGIVLFLTARARIKAAGERVAALMAKRPGGAPAPATMPRQTGSGISPSDAYYAGKMAGQLLQKVSFGNLGRRPNRPLPGPGEQPDRRPHRTTTVPPTPGPRGGGDTSSGPVPTPTPNSPDGASSAKQLRERVAQKQKINTTSKRIATAANLAGAAATGGTSAAAKAAAQAGAKKTAATAGRKMTTDRAMRRKALEDRLRTPPTTHARQPRTSQPNAPSNRTPSGWSTSSWPAAGTPASGGQSQHAFNQPLVAQRLKERLNKSGHR